MTNIVIYARYSSSAQTEQSIEGQLRVCHEYAEKKGFNIINEYIDRAMTGTNDNRPAFQQMIEDSNKKEFIYILVYKLDRFSRNKYDNAIYKHKLEQNGIKVISATESISNTPEGLLMEGLLEMFAEMYSKDLSQKVKRGIRENSLKGLYSGGKLPYGYKAINKKIYIDEEKVPAVKLIFEEYAKGTKKQEIINMLNNLGFRNNAGKKFTSNSIDRTLSNKKYIGIYKDNYIESNTFYPAIINEELFNKVQEQLKFKKKYKKTSKENFILTGKLFCGHCGESMVGTSGYGHNKTKYTYYGCLNKLQKHTCHKKNEPQLIIETKIFNKIKNKVLNENNLSEIAENIIEEYKNNLNQQTINNLNSKINQINTKLDNITEQLINTTNKDLITRFNKTADELTNEKEIYESEIKKLKLALQVKHSKKNIIEYLKMFLSGDEKDYNYQVKLIKYFVNAIYVFDNYLYIHFNIINNNKTISLQEVKEKISKISHINDIASPKHLLVFFYSPGIRAKFHFAFAFCKSHDTHGLKHVEDASVLWCSPSARLRIP